LKSYITRLARQTRRSARALLAATVPEVRREVELLLSDSGGNDFLDRPAIQNAPELLAGLAGAQCVICYRTAHAQQDARSQVLNAGILILGTPPFLILAGFVAFVFRKDDVSEE
jgi:hypothetical protein